jgi:hypothetical protein
VGMGTGMIAMPPHRGSSKDIAAMEAVTTSVKMGVTMTCMPPRRGNSKDIPDAVMARQTSISPRRGTNQQGCSGHAGLMRSLL